MTPRIGAIVLAAGGSRRLGRPKQLVPVGDRSLVAHIAAAVCAAPVAPVAVVLGAHADACARSLAGLPVQLLFNRAWPEGMASSIRLAAAWADRAGCDGALLCLCNQVRLGPAHLGALVAAHAASDGPVASRYGGALGVPALFPRRSFPRLLALAGDGGAQDIIRAEPAVTAIDWPDGALADTEADVAALGG